MRSLSAHRCLDQLPPHAHRLCESKKFVKQFSHANVASRSFYEHCSQENRSLIASGLDACIYNAQLPTKLIDMSISLWMISRSACVLPSHQIRTSSLPHPLSSQQSRHLLVQSGSLPRHPSPQPQCFCGLVSTQRQAILPGDIHRCLSK